MQLRQLDGGVYVAPQIAVSDIPALKAQGIRAIICNRPDGESGDQPGFEEIEQAARAEGIEARYLPVVSGKVSDESAVEFGSALDEMPGPVLAYCRSGMRSATLWALSQADRRFVADLA